ncbi:MAG: hypothetical protein IKD66_11775 [Solobacterium sp.]|nr:hypothetical protein [Solobacterium sp.]
MIMKLSEKLSNSKAAKFVPLVLLAVFELWYFVFLNQNIDSLINADDASELLLGRILAQEHAILSQSWYYSTEIRFLNTNLIYGPLFLFLKNWHTIRIVSLVILHVLLLASFYYFMQRMGRKDLFPAAALAVMVPLTRTYCWVVVRIPYYVPYLIISCLTLGFLFVYQRSAGKKKTAVLIGSAVLALLACAGGARQAIALYVPLLFTALFFLGQSLKDPEADQRERVNDLLKFAGILFISACIGFLINSAVMSRLYSFRSWTFGFTFFSTDRFKEVVDGVLSSFGYHDGPVTMKRTLMNAAAMILFLSTILSLWYALGSKKKSSEQYRFLAVFYVSAFVVFALLYSMTSMYYQYRYNIPFFIFSFPLICFWISESDWFAKVRPLLTAGFVMVMCLGAVLTYNEERIAVIMDDTNEQLSEISSKLLSENYTEGYSVYSYANILTELSDGAIDVWFWNDPYLAETEHLDEIYEWLQPKRHKTTPPQGKVFLLLSEENLESCLWKEQLSDDRLLMRTDELLVYGFGSHEEIVRILEGH